MLAVKVDPLRRAFGLYFVLHLTTSKEILLVSMAGFITGGFKRADLCQKDKKRKDLGCNPLNFFNSYIFFFKEELQFF